MLEISALSGGWGVTNINEDINLSIASGESVSIIGRNGVGKTTLLELIVGRAQRRAGTIKLDGIDLSKLSTHQRAARGIGYVPQNREIFRSLTVHEHMEIARRPGRWTANALYTMFPRLAARKRALAIHLSGGEQRMLAIARALAGNPLLLLMDEPSEGLAPIIVEALVESMQSLIAGGGMALLLVEQRTDLAATLSRRCLVMDRGRIVHQFSSDDYFAAKVDLATVMGLTAGPDR